LTQINKAHAPSELHRGDIDAHWASTVLKTASNLAEFLQRK